MEGWRGQRLFARSGRRMAATPVARAFAAEVGFAFDRVMAAAQASGRPGPRRESAGPRPTFLEWLVAEQAQSIRPDSLVGP